MILAQKMLRNYINLNDMNILIYFSLLPPFSEECLWAEKSEKLFLDVLLISSQWYMVSTIPDKCFKSFPRIRISGW